MIKPARITLPLLVLVALLLLGPALSAEAADRPLPDWATPLAGKKVVGVITSRKIVALTIDDVRSSQTASMTDELVRDNLTVSLFCVASEIDTAAAQYAAGAGMEIADHGWTHIALGSMSSEEASEALDSSAQRLYDMVGYWPPWYRSPYLEEGPNGVKEANEHGMLYAHISWNSRDYDAGMTSATVAASVSAGLRPGGVVDLHETTTTIAALPLIAKVLKDRGYECLTMSQLATAAPAATSIAMMWKAPSGLARPTVVGRATAKHGTTVVDVLTPARSQKLLIRVERRKKNGKYTSYRSYSAKTSSAGAWKLKLKLPKGGYRIRTSVAISDVYRSAMTSWTKVWVY
ncbi:MAG: polysaccharide deacetylase family protein [Coriobacteriia bacterium]|nr:polysaccharide deacetylase family protein [Coriobacteriia bacterium]